MKPTLSQQFSYTMLFDPMVARAAAERAAQWDLPRHICRPLDRYLGSRVSADLAAYDAAVELATVPEEELLEEQSSTDSRIADTIGPGPDFEDGDDL